MDWFPLDVQAKVIEPTKARNKARGDLQPEQREDDIGTILERLRRSTKSLCLHLLVEGERAGALTAMSAVSGSRPSARQARLHCA
jgi:hypothetical protein